MKLQRWVHYLPSLGAAYRLLEATVSKQISYVPVLLVVTEVGGRGWESSQGRAVSPARIGGRLRRRSDRDLRPEGLSCEALVQGG